VALARALVYRTPLILADEPTGQLDRATALHVLDALLAAVAERGTALVVATHDPRVAGRMDKRWELVHGVLQEAA
jgi:predicted ABC-type transport system involved in lysophospholipase L1 biosynthesis ATPase subunit